jgi:hypothetical protein
MTEEIPERAQGQMSPRAWGFLATGAHEISSMSAAVVPTDSSGEERGRYDK